MIHHRFENFLSLVVQKLPNDPAAVEGALEATLQRKGIVLDALSQERQRLLRTEKPEVIETMEQLRQITTQLSALTLAGPGKQAVEVYRNRLAQLQTEMEQLEKALAQQSQAFRAGQQGRLVKAEGVAHALKSDQALIEYISFRNSDFMGTDAAAYPCAIQPMAQYRDCAPELP